MKTALLFAAFLLAGPAQAQAVWRCGPEGRSYSATPCPEGRVVAVADPRSAADMAAGREVAQRETTLARELVQQRREREKERELEYQAMARHEPGLRRGEPAPGKIKAPAVPNKAQKRPRQQQAAELTPSRTATGGTSSAVAPASRQKRG